MEEILERRSQILVSLIAEPGKIWGQKTPEAVMNAWMNSEGHRANILNPNFKKLGVGYRTDSQRTPYWTQLFTY